MSQQQNAGPAQTYEEYLVPGIHARWTLVFLDHAEPRPGERVLDAACGTGIVACYVSVRHRESLLPYPPLPEQRPLYAPR